MAFPFGGHPTFSDYLQWAISQGCTVKSGINISQSISLTKIIPTTIARLDRRLGLASPWFSVPEGTKPS